MEGNMYVARVPCDPKLYAYIIGKGGARKKEMEAASGARLSVPSRGQQRPSAAAPAAPGAAADAGTLGAGVVTVRALDERSLGEGVARVQAAIAAAVSAGSHQLDYNYFLSVPLRAPGLVQRLLHFQEQALALPGAQQLGLDPSIFTQPQQLHLTIQMLKLYAPAARREAARLLTLLAPAAASLLGGRPLVLRLRGLAVMNDQPSAAHVLYLQVHQEQGPAGVGRLEALCQLLTDAFRRAGLVPAAETRALKLHVTLINTRHRADSGTTAADSPARVVPAAAQARAAIPSGGEATSTATGGATAWVLIKPLSAAAGGVRAGSVQGSAARRWRPFDAQPLLQLLGGLDLGEVLVEAIHLSQRSEPKQPDGYYACAAQLRLAGSLT